MIRYLLITIDDANENEPVEKDEFIEALERIDGVTVEKIEEGV